MRKNKISAVIDTTSNSSLLGALTEKRAISTLLFYCKYRLIDFPVSSMMNAGSDSIYFGVSHRSSQSVFDHLGSGREWGFDGIRKRYFMHVVQENQFLATTEYYTNLIDYLKKSDSQYTLFMGTNMIANVNFKQVIEYHQEHNSVVTAVYKKMPKDQIHTEDIVLDIDEFGEIDSVQQFKHTSMQQPFDNLGMNSYVVNTSWLIERLQIAQQNAENSRLETILAMALNCHINTAAYEYKGHLSNIFDIPSYFRGNMDMLDYNKVKGLLMNENKVHTKLKNEPPTYFSPDSETRKSQFAAGCIIYGAVNNCLLSRNVVVETGAKVSNAILMPGTKVGAGADVQYAIIDKDVVIEPGAVVKGTLNNPFVISKGSRIKVEEGRRITA